MGDESARGAPVWERGSNSTEGRQEGGSSGVVCVRDKATGAAEIGRRAARWRSLSRSKSLHDNGLLPDTQATADVPDKPDIGRRIVTGGRKIYPATLSSFQR